MTDYEAVTWTEGDREVGNILKNVYLFTEIYSDPLMSFTGLNKIRS